MAKRDAYKPLITPEGGSSMSTAVAAEAATQRQLWRVIVRTGSMYGASREGDRTEWHLVDCQGNHCSQGEELLAVRGEPAGHCLIDGRCGLGEEHP